MRSIQEWRKGVVRACESVADDVRQITIDVDGAVPVFDPGSHTQIKVKIGGLQATRSYTVLPGNAGSLTVAVKLHPSSRGGSAYMWSLKEGDSVEVTVPENRFELSWRASHYLLIAGGIGITPIFGMAKALAEAGKPFRLIYGAKSRGQMAFLEKLRAIADDKMELFIEDEGKRFDLGAEIAALPDDGEAYVCGPLGLLEGVKSEWAKTSRSPGRLRFEVFGDSGKFPEMPFTVELPKLKKTVEVRSDQSLLTALTDAGVDMVFDCQRGECGLCAVDIVEADCPVDHRDVFFSSDEKIEGRRMCACVSRLAGGRAVIDNGYVA